MMVETDFLVVGAGIAGAGVAYFLAPHARVTVIDMEEQAGYHTTGRSAAFYAETYGGPKLQPLTTASKDFLRAPPSDVCDRPILSQLGAIHIFREDQRAAAEAAYAQLAAALPGVRMLTKEQVLARLPYLLPDRIVGGIDDPDCGDLDVAALHQGYLRGAKKHGAQVQLAAGLEEAAHKNGAWHIKTRTGSITAGTIVNAGGAWADEVAEKAGVRTLGLTPKRRTIITVPNPEGLPFNKRGPIVMDVEEDFYFKPEGAGYLISPADEGMSDPCDAQPELEDIAIAADKFEQATGAAVARLEAKWAGLRTFSPDRAPVIGYDADQKGFFWNAGQGGYGIQTSPAWSMLAASMLLNQGIPDALAKAGVRAELYDPARFSR